MPDDQQYSQSPPFLIVGKILKPHGIRGAVKVQSITDHPERFKQIDMIYIGNEEQPKKEYQLEQVVFTPKHLVIYLNGVNSRNDAEVLRDRYLYVPKPDAIVLPEGAFFYYELIGMQVQDETGVILGIVKDVVDYPAQRLLVVKKDSQDYLVPDVPDIVRNIDAQTRKITIHVIEGLFE